MKLSYSDVLKELNYAFYVEGKSLPTISAKNKTDDKIKEDPLFTQIVILDTNAAHLQTKLNTIDIKENTELVGIVNVGLSQMGQHKQTVSYQSTFTSDATPILEKAKQEALQKQEIETQVQEHIKQIHADIPEIIKEIKAGKGK